MPAIKIGLLYPFTIYHLQPEKLLGKPMNGIMLRIDMFALLRLLLSRMVDCLNLNWMQSTRYLRTAGKVIVRRMKLNVKLVLSQLCS